MRLGNISKFVAIALCVTAAVGAESLLQRASRIAPPAKDPYAGSEPAQQAGGKLFERECSGCHGEDGRGNGRRGTPPLTTPLVRQADPGGLFWILRNGSASHRMPSFSHLPEQRRWQIIAYLQKR
jgi:mono/diheme cytochrome c family protein